MTLELLALLIAAALCGSVPFGFLLAKRFLDVDLQAVGSGKIGATNASRAGGYSFGALVLGLDGLKGFAPPSAAAALGMGPEVVAGAGLAAVIGHCYTPFLGFRGGKGVATSLGVIVALDPLLGVAGLLAFAAVVAMSRVSALGSLAGTGVAVAGAWFWRGETLALPSRIVLLCIFGLIVWRHRSNLQALRHGQVEESDE